MTTISPVSSPSVKFGWTKDNPPDYKISLTGKDILNRSNPRSENYLQPSGSLVEGVVKKIIRTDDDQSPGFCELTGAKKVLKTNEKIDQFQVNLMEKVESYLRRHYPEMLRYRRPFVENETTVMSTSKVLSKFADGLRTVGGNHFDFVKWPVFSLHYHQPVNLKKGTGLAQVLDIRQAAKNLELPYRGESLQRRYNSSEGEYAVASPVLEKEALKNCVIQIDTTNDPILLINNFPENGIMHGGLSWEMEDETKSDKTQRKFQHVIIQLST